MTSRLAETLELFDSVPDPADRTSLLLDFADRFETVPPSVARKPYDKAHLVPHCESEAYVWVLKQPDGTVKLYFAVENPSGVSAKALAAILDRGLSGLPPQEVATVDPSIVERIFRANISMGKGLGLMSMVQAVRSAATILSA
jgi:sulfur transfer protein SufE